MKWEMKRWSGSGYGPSQGNFIASTEVTMGHIGAIGMHNTTILFLLTWSSPIEASSSSATSEVFEAEGLLPFGPYLEPYECSSPFKSSFLNHHHYHVCT
jgi:hypothetical protein